MFDPFKTRYWGCTQPYNAPLWALLIGETYASSVHAQARRRPHPGLLPDVDFSRRGSTAHARASSSGSSTDPDEGTGVAEPVGPMPVGGRDEAAIMRPALAA